MSTKKLSLLLLSLLIVSAIDSIRNLPASALFGSSLIFFFLFSALVFLIPVSLISAELSAAFPTHGGVYHWVRLAFGEKAGLLAIWLQWINTMIWYPTILSFIAGVGAYLINPALSNNSFYLVSVILCLFWVLTFINLFGLKISALLNSCSTFIGTIFPMLFLIVLGIIWLVSGYPLQIQFNIHSMIPSWDTPTNWISLTAIMASFLGMELAGVHINDIRDPQKTFPRAMGCALLFLLFSLLFGSLSIAIVLPPEEINLVSGVMQVFTAFFQAFHMEWAIPCLTLLILIGSLGNMINWLISPAKGLLHAAEFGFLPTWFTRLNRYGVAHNILLTQALLVSFFCLAFLLVPSINGFYWFLTDLSTELYMLMYLLLFAAAIRLHHLHPHRPAAFKIPGGSWGIWITSLAGLFGCLITLFVGFFPPEHIDAGTPLEYASWIFIGNILAVMPVLLLYRYQRHR